MLFGIGCTIAALKETEVVVEEFISVESSLRDRKDIYQRIKKLLIRTKSEALPIRDLFRSLTRIPQHRIQGCIKRLEKEEKILICDVTGKNGRVMECVKLYDEDKPQTEQLNKKMSN